MNVDDLREAIASDNPGRARPALASLVNASPEEAEPLLLLGLEQDDMILRQLSCSGLGHKPTPAGWEPLVQTLKYDSEVAVRAEAANALVSHGLDRAWPLLLDAFVSEDEWLIRCSILSAVAEHPEIAQEQLLQLARLAVAEADGTVRVGGTEILARLVREGSSAAREVLQGLQQDSDHRVVAAALNGLQSQPC
ncbi:HEAT repeat domain-containing protein [Synechococcus sp. A10-1-5-1]|uniref:HEAT repeat domain-containing protein n=1 Tax=Synechococcus sp. A10-1-5-1 TaxID=2936507 RepID=UPI002000ECCC|nr:HEAT repeat domain-containing protein [Synechococcus sp. A10-1-5-1]UPM49337.1 HEAT repeat domain-containing protein [Synechococcus sp. A10-1-5-1]